MSTTELRKRLVERIQSTNDESILEEIYRILEVSSEEEKPIILSTEQKARIDDGLKDIEEGRFLTNDKANNEIEEWLKK